MRCNSVLLGKKVSNLKNLLSKKKTISAVAAATPLPLVAKSLLNTDKNPDTSIKEQDVLFKNALEEIYDGKPRFTEKGKYILESYYKKAPQIVLLMINTKKQDGSYKYNDYDIDSLLYRLTDNDFKCFNSISPNIAQEILSNNAIPEKNLSNILKLASKHPEEYLKIKESRLFELIDSGKIDADILDKINQNIYLSDQFLMQIKDRANKKELVKVLPPESNFEQMDDAIEDGRVYQIKDDLFMSCLDKKYYTKLNISREKFDDLFGHSQYFALRQGNIGDCWFLSAIDGLMNSNAGMAFIYNLFEQDGEDILIKFPKSKQKIRFKNGELGKADSGLVAPKGIKMLEQAMAVHLKTIAQKNEEDVAVQEIKDLESCMKVLQGGNARYGLYAILGKYYKPVESLVQHIKKKYNEIKFGYTHKISKNEKIRYIEKIKNFASDSNKIVNINFYNFENFDNNEKLILPEYNIYTGHSYCVKKYNKEAGTVILSNPHDTRSLIEVPISIIEKYIINCGATTFHL